MAGPSVGPAGKAGPTETPGWADQGASPARAAAMAARAAMMSPSRTAAVGWAPAGAAGAPASGRRAPAGPGGGPERGMGAAPGAAGRRPAGAGARGPGPAGRRKLSPRSKGVARRPDLVMRGGGSAGGGAGAGRNACGSMKNGFLLMTVASSLDANGSGVRSSSPRGRGPAPEAPAITVGPDPPDGAGAPVSPPAAGRGGAGAPARAPPVAAGARSAPARRSGPVVFAPGGSSGGPSDEGGHIGGQSTISFRPGEGSRGRQGMGSSCGSPHSRPLLRIRGSLWTLTSSPRLIDAATIEPSAAMP